MEKIKIQAPDGHTVTVELKDNMFFIEESMFLFTDMEDLIKTAKKYNNDGRRIQGVKSEETRQAGDEAEAEKEAN